MQTALNEALNELSIKLDEDGDEGLADDFVLQHMASYLEKAVNEGATFCQLALEELDADHEALDGMEGWFTLPLLPDEEEDDAERAEDMRCRDADVCVWLASHLATACS